MEQVREDLKDTLLAFRARYGVGRAIAAPQIGVKKRVIYRHLDTPVLFINPRLAFPEQEMIDVLDDCMSFPDLLVRVSGINGASYIIKIWNGMTAPWNWKGICRN